MIVCIDTNSLVQLFGKRSPYRAIVVALMSGRIELAVSSAILLEYEEVAAAMYGPMFAKEVMPRATKVLTMDKPVEFAGGGEWM